MKTFLPIMIIAGVITACGGNPNIGAPFSTLPVSADTSGFSEFQQWKSYEQSQPKTKTVYVVKHVPTTNSTSNRNPETNNQQSPNVPANAEIPGASQPETTQKKGWSKAAKGAAIGAGSGAVLGAVIHKRNRVVGGVVGGAVGAGVGYGIGRHMDKKDGRY